MIWIKHKGTSAKSDMAEIVLIHSSEFSILVNTVKVNGVQHCFGPFSRSLYGQKQIKYCSKRIPVLHKRNKVIQV